MYAKYEKCDPLSTKQVAKLDQMLPYFVMDVAGNIPGLPGVFVAGIFSAALSSMSSSLNTVAGTIYEDFVRPRYPNNTEKQASDVMKGLVVVLGFLILALVFVVERMGQVFQVAIVISGLTAGTLLGMFTIGMVSRRVNARGLMIGSITSMICVGILMVGSQFKPKPPPLSLRTDGCDAALFNSTQILNLNQPVDMDDFPWVFRISFMYLGTLGMIILIVVAYIASYIDGNFPEFDERLLAKFCRRKIVEKPVQYNNVKYSDISETLD